MDEMNRSSEGIAEVQTVAASWACVARLEDFLFCARCANVTCAFSAEHRFAFVWPFFDYEAELGCMLLASPLVAASAVVMPELLAVIAVSLGYFEAFGADILPHRVGNAVPAEVILLAPCALEPFAGNNLSAADRAVVGLLICRHRAVRRVDIDKKGVAVGAPVLIRLPALFAGGRAALRAVYQFRWQRVDLR